MLKTQTATRYLPIPSSTETWKIFTKHAVSIFFSAWADILSKKTPYFGKPLFFAEQELIMGARLCAHDFIIGQKFLF